MKRSGGILWIDDNPDRRKRARQLGSDARIDVAFVSLKGKDVEQELLHIRRSPKPGLVIIDHVLNDTKSAEWARLGSTLVGFFRETWPGRPVFGITAAKNLKDVDVETYVYDELIDYTEFGMYTGYLPLVIEGFNKCAGVKDVEGWLSLLKCPQEEAERVKSCLPHDVKTGFDKPGYPNRAYRWFRRKCYGLPGFLYDKNWVATFAGIKRQAIAKYLKHFEGAQYTGIFNNPEDPRWWKAELYKSIYAKCKAADATCRSTQNVGNVVAKVTDSDRSECYKCHEAWPETIAYTDDSENAALKQMHLRCTVAHPRYRYEPMFEEIRMMA